MSILIAGSIIGIWMMIPISFKYFFNEELYNEFTTYDSAILINRDNEYMDIDEETPDQEFVIVENN